MAVAPMVVTAVVAAAAAVAWKRRRQVRGRVAAVKHRGI